MLYPFFLNKQKMLGVAQPFGFATPTFIIEPFFVERGEGRGPLRGDFHCGAGGGPYGGLLPFIRAGWVSLPGGGRFVNRPYGGER